MEFARIDSVRRAVALGLVVFLVLLGALAWLAAPRIGPGPAILLGVPSAALWLTLLGAIRLAWQRLRLGAAWRRTVEAAAAGGLPSADRLCVLSGRLEGDGDQLRSPLHDQPCLGYAYDVVERDPARGAGRFHWFGAAQQPCRLVTSTGTVRVAGRLPLEGLEPAARGVPARERFEALIGWPGLRDVDGRAGLAAVLDEADAALGDPSSAHRFDLVRPLGPVSAEPFRFEERRLEPGVEVTLVGPFDPARGQGPGLEVFPGPAEAVVPALRSEALRALLFVGAFVAVAQAFLAAMVVLAGGPNGGS